MRLEGLRVLGAVEGRRNWEAGLLSAPSPGGSISPGWSRRWARASRDQGIPRGAGQSTRVPGALPSPGLFLLQNKALVDT